MQVRGELFPGLIRDVLGGEEEVELRVGGERHVGNDREV